MTLAELARHEDELMQRLSQAYGSTEEKTEQLRKAGAFSAHREVHRAYVGLLPDPEAGAEALKRASFLSWYEVAEPPCFTGVADLAPEATRAVLERLEILVGAGRLDFELQWMLRHYHAISDSFIDMQPGLPLLKAWLTEADAAPLRRETLEESDFRGRGQMGHYTESD